MLTRKANRLTANFARQFSKGNDRGGKGNRTNEGSNDLQQSDDQNEQDTVNNLMRDLMKNTPQAK